jgi:hypothetical protein
LLGLQKTLIQFAQLLITIPYFEKKPVANDTLYWFGSISIALQRLIDSHIHKNIVMSNTHVPTDAASTAAAAATTAVREWQNRCRACEDVTCDTQRCRDIVAATLKPLDGMTDASVWRLLKDASFDKAGNCWKYDACNFCGASYSCTKYKILLEGDEMQFCSSKCLFATMKRASHTHDQELAKKELPT